MSDLISPAAIRTAREAAGLTQDEAAVKTGLTRATIQNAETGRRSPSGVVLVALSRAYGVPMEAFVAHDVDAATPTTRRVHGAPVTEEPAADLPRYSATGSR